LLEAKGANGSSHIVPVKMSSLDLLVNIELFSLRASVAAQAGAWFLCVGVNINMLSSADARRLKFERGISTRKGWKRTA